MNIREYEVKVKLPKELKPLETMAYNLWFAWNSPATALYKNIEQSSALYFFWFYLFTF